MNKHGGYFGKEEIIDFSVNINPLGVSEKVIKKVHEVLGDIIKYPEIDGKSTRNIIAEKLDFKSEEIILGNGATELIYLFARAIKPKKVLIIQPTFNEYKRAFKLNEATVVNFINKWEDDFDIDIDSLILKIRNEKPKVLVLCNPNNPTGGQIKLNKLKIILEELNKINSYMLLDESFIDFSENKSLESLINNYNIFILRSMTKYYAIPGLRLGFGLGNKKLIDLLNAYKEPWTINSLSLSIVESLLDDYEYINKTKEWYVKEKEYLYQEIKKLDKIKIYESDTNFFICKLENSKSKELNDFLLNEKIYIRTCEDFIGLDETFFRIAVKNHYDNVKLIESLREYTTKY